LSPSVLDALVASDVDQHAARDQRSHIVDAELIEAGPGHDLAGLEAVVVAAGVALVGEAIELGADLADLREHHLLVGDAVVGAGHRAGNLDMHVEAARAGERHVGVEHVRELDDLAGLDQLERIEHRLRLHVVGRAALVTGAPFRWTALAVGRRQPRRRLSIGGERPEQEG